MIHTETHTPPSTRNGVLTYANATPVVVATALRVLAASFEHGSAPAAPSEQTVNLLREAAERIIDAQALP
ncbi:hypothetical protein ACFVU2_18980 [Leifsonia sp. NPDC058194]|uniref:hypothetical protein n=1 Tax=Leifsonia sp. NPDC058194 TaxID=3346374 RepID=UPI0036DD86AC